MIFLRMLSPDLQELEALAELLLRKQLAMDINIKKGIERLELQDDRVQKRTINLLTAKTKGLLFNEIQQYRAYGIVCSQETIRRLRQGNYPSY